METNLPRQLKYKQIEPKDLKPNQRALHNFVAHHHPSKILQHLESQNAVFREDIHLIYSALKNIKGQSFYALATWLKHCSDQAVGDLLTNLTADDSRSLPDRVIFWSPEREKLWLEVSYLSDEGVICDNLSSLRSMLPTDFEAVHMLYKLREDEKGGGVKLVGPRHRTYHLLSTSTTSRVLKIVERIVAEWDHHQEHAGDVNADGMGDAPKDITSQSSGNVDEKLGRVSQDDPWLSDSDDLSNP